MDEVDRLLRRIGRGDGDDGDVVSIRAASSALVEIERGMQRLVIELTRSGVTIAEPDVEQHLADAARLFERANDTFTRAFLTYDPDPGSSAGR